MPDGFAALAALAAQSFDLLLCDIVMPGLDGIALALKAGKDYPALKILLMTGYSAERQRAHNLAALVAPGYREALHPRRDLRRRR